MRRGLCVVAAAMAFELMVSAHSGPPYPIVSKRALGAYVVSLWTDPDTTDDGSAAGQFWVVFDEKADDARVDVAVWPRDRDGTRREASAAPVDGDRSRRFAAVNMDHEGPYNVRVTVDGKAGAGTIDASVDATYDLRPQPYLILVYLLPFVLIGLLWLKLLLRRVRREAP